ncbi:DUF4129 domain-containing protein [Flavobacterium sp. RHBU_24]|uniref:DUF4129 domain-containing protein n=1 Tax=Flavobacterium sp. RHBU_24 TaxID=3391185 RepID=UPI0039851EBA
MTRILIYISFLLLPLSNYAWQDADVDTVVVGDSATVDGYGSGNYEEDGYEEKQTAATPPPPPVYVKKSFDRDFKKRYTDDDFNYKEEKAGDSWGQQFFSWIRSVLDAIFGSKGETRTRSNTGRSFPIYEIMAVIVLLVVVYFIARAILQKEGYWIFGRSSKRIVSNDLTVENLHEVDFATRISQTKANNDYRLALRYYYLWLLKKMAARNIIDWNWEKTNSDYYYEIKDNTLRDDFKYLSYVYDHSWYGEFPIDEKSFGKAEAAFQKTLNTI